MRRFIPALVGAVLSTAPALAQPQSIAEIAPPETMAMLSIDDFPALRAAFQKSVLMDMLDDPEIRPWLEQVWEDSARELREELQMVDAQLEDLPWPAGLFGGAIWWGADPDAETPALRFLMTAEFEDEDAAGEMMAVLEDMIDERLDALFMEAVEVAGIDAWALTTKEQRRGDQPRMALADEEVYFGLFDSFLVLASDTGAFERAIDVLDGERLPSMADHEAHQEARRAVGDAQARLSGFMQPFIDAMNFEYDNAEQWSPLRQLPLPPGGLASALGLDELKAGALGVELAGERLATTRLAVIAPTRRGLLTLFTEPLRFEAPGFIGADAANVNVFSMNFSRILPLARDVIALLPDPDRTQARGVIEGFAPAFEPALRSLGPEIYAMNTIDRPFAWDSERNLVAIRTNNRQAINAVLTQFGALAGLTARDFQGAQIWETSALAPGIETPALGVGAGHLFFGQAPEIENALRTAQADEAPRLADEPAFQRARQSVRREGAMFEYTDARATLEYRVWTFRNQVDVTMAMLRSLWGEGLEEEDARQMREDVEEQTPEWLGTIPSAEVWLKHVGDMVAQGHWNDRGFFAATHLLAPGRD